MENKIEKPARKAMNLFLKLLFAIGFVIIGLAVLFYRADLNLVLSEIKKQEKIALSRQSNTIREKFDTIVGDLLFLSSQNELNSYLKVKDIRTIKAIQAEYIEIAKNRNIYDQMRYLDKKGMEIVRVNFNEGKPEAVPEEELQNKFKRYYFTDTFVLAEREIFVSPLDLNIEEGVLEIPFKPMIRFGTPVFDDNGTKRGMVLLNYLAADFLKSIDVKDENDDRLKMLINMEGYWLLHPDKEKEWGFMCEDRAEISFASSYPEEWRLIRDQGDGQIVTKNGLFTFVSVYPLQEGFRSSSGSGKAYQPSVKDLDPLEYSWIMMSQIPSGVISSHTQEMMGSIIAISAGLFIIISFGAWQLALAITNRRIYEAQLLEMAHYDALTSLPNRKMFLDRLEEGIAHNTRHERKLGLLYIDLDGFKNVNDSMGHDGGDELLVKVGENLKQNIRNTDTVARIGGDEFAVILLEIKEKDDALLIGEKLVAALSKPFELRAGTAMIGASIGIAIFPDCGETADSLIKEADQAMYKAKSEGKNTCIIAGNVHDS